MPAYHHGNLRATLLEAAERSLREHGAEQLSLRELAREAGVSHAAPRRHFADRQALLDAMAETGFARLETELRAALATAGADFPARLHAVAAAYLRFATEDSALLDVMYAGKHRDDRVAEAAAVPFGLLNDVIKDGQERGAIAPGDPHRPGVLLLASLQGIAALTNGRLVVPELLDGILETAVDQFLRGQQTSDR